MNNCICCGKPTHSHYSGPGPIHTMCIVRHFGSHARGLDASRCKEFNSSGQLRTKVGE